MDIKNKRILEALRMQPLSQEEMTTRHILGRLYGPIATCIESTRNGRLYNKPLWERALADEVFLEKVATKVKNKELKFESLTTKCPFVGIVLEKATAISSNVSPIS